MRKGAIWTLTALVVIAAAAVFGFAMWHSYQTEQQRQVIDMDYEQEIRALFSEKTRIEGELLELDDFVSGYGMNLGSVIVLAAEPDSRVLTDIVPGMREQSYVGIIAVSQDYFPGETGCLSVDDMQMLINEGWEIALTAGAGTDPEALAQRLRESGLPKATAAYFPKGGYNADWEAVLAPLGLTAILQRGNLSEEQGELWEIRSIGSFETGAVEGLQTAAQQSECIVLSVGYHNSYETYTESNFKGLLIAIGNYAEEYGLSVTNAQTAQQRYASRQRIIAAQLSTIEQQRSALNTQLDTIWQRIDAVNQRYADTLMMLDDEKQLLALFE